MRIKNPDRVQAYRSLRKPLPPSQKVFATAKGKGGYDRKRERVLVRKDID